MSGVGPTLSLFEVLTVLLEELVDEVSVDVEPLVLLGGKGYRSLVQDAVLDENRRCGANGEGDGIAGTGVDVEPLVLRIDDSNAGVEDVVVQVGHAYLGDPRPELVDDRFQQVGSKRTGGLFTLQLHRDRRRLVGSHPDQEVSLELLVLQDDHTLTVRQVHSDALDDHGNQHAARSSPYPVGLILPPAQSTR